MKRSLFLIILSLFVLGLVVPSQNVSGQRNWSASLSVQPFPSPYISDWGSNPNIVKLIIGRCEKGHRCKYSKGERIGYLFAKDGTPFTF